MQYLAVFLGGGLGSMCRFALSKGNKMGWILPWGTIAANILSCLILGIIAGFIASKPNIPLPWKAFFAVGFCGGFSTFSTFSLESFLLLKSGEPFYALINIAFSMLVCLLAIFAGFTLADY